MSELEIMQKLYLELATVVPVGCVSVREKAMERQINKYGLALRMIQDGCANPGEVAAIALQWGDTP